MNQIYLWLGGILSVIYVALTTFAGYGLTKRGEIQNWAARAFILCGLLVLIAGVITFLRASFAMWVLIAGLLGIHALAINNGYRLFGKINPSHHLARLVVSVALITLTYLGLKESLEV